MNERLIRRYENELSQLRQLGAEFAAENPGIARNLAPVRFDGADPYVERLLEGCAFLAARIQLKLDAQFPRFTNHLLDALYPHLTPPTPSMAVVQFTPDAETGSLESGVVLPRGETVLRSAPVTDQGTRCEYRTAQDVTLWPITLTRAEYVSGPGAVAALGVPLGVQGGGSPRAALRLRLKTIGGLGFDALALDRLPLFLAGVDRVPVTLCELLVGATAAVVLRSPSDREASNRPAWQEVLPASAMRHRGFSEEEAMLPTSPRSFDGYRLLHEYFAFPERFQFVELCGLGRGVRRCAGDELEIILLFERGSPVLEGAVDDRNVRLFCSPAINLFPKRTDPIHLNPGKTEHHIVADGSRPLDFEVHSVLSLSGYAAGTETVQEFAPFYATHDQHAGGRNRAFYALSREPRLNAGRLRRNGMRTTYAGSELFVSLVDADEAPYSRDLRRLGVTALCTNRDLPLHMPVGRTPSDFETINGEPVQAVRCVAGPTRPRPSSADGPMAWRLISHLSVNYLSLADSDPQRGAEALREMLSLYAGVGDPAAVKRIDGVRHVATRPILRRVPGPGAIVHARGLEVAVTFDEQAFDGSGIFVLGAVLEEFFARYVSLNSFTETVIRSTERGEVMRWSARIGRRATL